MRTLTSLCAIMMAAPVFAESFDRPIPQAQSATAELWFAIGSLGLLAALAFVHWLVVRR